MKAKLTEADSEWFLKFISGFYGCSIRDQIKKIDRPLNECAITEAEGALVRCLLSKQLGKALIRLRSIVRDPAALEQHACLLGFIDHQLEKKPLPQGVILLETSPELFELFGEFIRKRRKSGKPSFVCFEPPPLDFQICVTWALDLHRATVTAGCAMACQFRQERIMFPAYRKALQRVGLKHPKNAQITAHNLGEHDPGAIMYIEAICKEAGSTSDNRVKATTSGKGRLERFDDQ